MPLRPCLTVGCPELVRSGYCPAHRQAATGHRGIYRDPRWATARTRALARAGGRCQAVVNQTRCRAVRGLQGHHAYPGGVKQMLLDGADPFDERRIVVLCDHHHGQLEALLRKSSR